MDPNVSGWTRGLRSDPGTPRQRAPLYPGTPPNAQSGDQPPPLSARGTPRTRYVSEEQAPPLSARNTPRMRHAAALGLTPQQNLKPGIPPKTPYMTGTKLSLNRLHSHDQEQSVDSFDESPSHATSLSGGDGVDEYEFDADSVQVLVRVRPPSADELARGGHQSCLSVTGTRRVSVRTPSQSNQFEFDSVLGDLSTQEERGLTPRVFDYLFEKIAQEEGNKEHEEVHYNCKISFLEIYNETIADLLDPKPAELQLREDRSGCFVDGLSEHTVLNSDDVPKSDCKAPPTTCSPISTTVSSQPA
eukprot:gene7671-828_t